MSEIAIDFDGTIAQWYVEGAKPIRGEGLRPPIDGMKALIEILIASGHKVTIFTARAQDASDEAEIRAWLVKYGFPSHLDITNVKRRTFQVIFDDRAVTMTNAFAELLKTSFGPGAIAKFLSEFKTHEQIAAMAKSNA